MPNSDSSERRGGLRRRDVLRAGAAVAATVLLAPALPLGAAASTNQYFRHGVASGDPLPDRVLLWTRVTPTEEATPGSGVGPSVPVSWEVADDAQFARVVAAGILSTGPEVDHTVKVDAEGLSAGTWYYFRFLVDGVSSPVGRTRTAPAELAVPNGLRFGVVSCSNWQAGHFAAYRHLAERRDLDAVLHLGDYLYEYAPAEYGAFRPHEPAREMTTLADYRQRHAQYKSDENLRALHASCPWIITWDDHETANDAWSDGAKNHQDGEGDWARRRAQALQAYQEWMPIRFGPGDTIYRRLRFGSLAEITMLDLRTYRSQQVEQTDLGSADDPDRTITGPAQLSFLRAGLVDPGVQWKLVGNPVMFAQLLVPPLPRVIGMPLADLVGLFPGDGVPINVDQWDGYQHERNELIAHLADNGVQNTVFLTGDIHTSWAFDVPIDAGMYPLSRTVATELVVPSVTSDNIDEMTGAPPRTASIAAEEALRAVNRHLKWVELDSHGYTVLDVRPDRLQMDWYFLTDREDANSAATYAKSFVVVAGSQRVQPASTPVV